MMGTFTMNGTMYMPPTVPVLLQILSGVKKPEELLPQGSIIGLPSNSVIELSLPGGSIMSTGPHPFHLHGVSVDFVVFHTCLNQLYYSLLSALYEAPAAANTTTTIQSGGMLSISVATRTTM